MKNLLFLVKSQFRKAAGPDLVAGSMLIIRKYQIRIHTPKNLKNAPGAIGNYP